MSDTKTIALFIQPNSSIFIVDTVSKLIWKLSNHFCMAHKDLHSLLKGIDANDSGALIDLVKLCDSKKIKLFRSKCSGVLYATMIHPKTYTLLPILRGIADSLYVVCNEWDSYILRKTCFIWKINAFFDEISGCDQLSGNTQIPYVNHDVRILISSSDTFQEETRVLLKSIDSDKFSRSYSVESWEFFGIKNYAKIPYYHGEVYNYNDNLDVVDLVKQKIATNLIDTATKSSILSSSPITRIH